MTRSHTYKKYKPSGVAWLGDVPAHWAAQRGKFLFSYQKQVNVGLMVDDRLALTLNGVIERDIEEDAGLQPTDFESYQIFKSDDLVFKLIDLENLQTSRVGYVPKTGIMSPAYIRLSSRGESATKFFYYFYYSLWLRHIFKILGGQGVRSSLNASELLDVVLPLPPLEEQEAIAAYLDDETARIDEIIERKQRQIGLLEDKRRALITHAVTRGLNPKAKMKDSGCFVLGDIPRHWKVMPIWSLFEIGRGRVISSTEISENNGEYPVYSSQTKDEGVLGYIETFDFHGDYLTWTTDGAQAGTVFRREGKFNCTNVCGTLRLKQPALADFRFLQFIIGTISKFYVRYDINPKLMNDVMAGIRVSVPPLNEQTAIAEYLDEHTAWINSLIYQINESLDLLSERRAALITAAVTGQIKVA